MPSRDLLDEAAKHMQHVGQRLARARLRKDDGEIDWMAFTQRHPDLGIVFESPDPRTMPGAWIDNQRGRLVLVDAVTGATSRRLGDPEQCVIGRPLEDARVNEHFPFEVEQRRKAEPLVFEEIVGALAQSVPEQHGPLGEVSGIGREIAEFGAFGWDRA